MSSFIFYRCGKSGHKATECWAEKAGTSSFGSSAFKSSGSMSTGTTPTVTCYSCGEIGHKSPQCTKGVKVEKPTPKDVTPKAVRRMWMNQLTDVQLSGKVNGRAVPILLDSGASISVVPESMVDKVQMTGSTVAVKPFGSRKPLLLPTTEVPFSIGSLE